MTICIDRFRHWLFYHEVNMLSPIISPKCLYCSCNHLLTLSGSASIQLNHWKRYSDLKPNDMSSQIVGSPVQSKRDNLTIIIAGYAHSKMLRISWHVISLGHALPLKTTPFQRTVTAPEDQIIRVNDQPKSDILSTRL